MKKQLLYATTNPGKLFEVSRYLGQFGIKVYSPADFNLSVEVAETAATLAENSKMKVKTYLDQGVNCLVMADDTGVEIDALKGEPGIHVRRWKDGKTPMTDQEIIDYCLFRMRKIHPLVRQAKFTTVLSLGIPHEEIDIYVGELNGTILEEPSKFAIEGFPFESLFYIPQWEMVLGEVHRLPIEKKIHYLTHRELAVKKSLPRIQQLLFGDF